MNDSVYFLNVTSIKDDKDCIEKINKTLNLEGQKVSSIPTIIYYNEGKV